MKPCGASRTVETEGAKVLSEEGTREQVSKSKQELFKRSRREGQRRQRTQSTLNPHRGPQRCTYKTWSLQCYLWRQKTGQIKTGILIQKNTFQPLKRKREIQEAKKS